MATWIYLDLKKYRLVDKLCGFYSKFLENAFITSWNRVDRDSSNVDL